MANVNKRRPLLSRSSRISTQEIKRTKFLRMRIMLQEAKDSIRCARQRPDSEPRRSFKPRVDCNPQTTLTKARRMKKTAKMATASTKTMKKTKRVTTISDS